jgi:hypothetical protein
MKKWLVVIGGLIFIIGVYFISNDIDNSTVKKINYNGKSLMVNIDGVYSDKIPTSGNYYLLSYKCSNSKTVVSWDNEKKSLSFSNGTNSGGISCSLNFSEKLLLVNVKAGSYVKYCVDGNCEFNNVSYVDDNNMGYCGYKGSSYYSSDSDRQFVSNGFRVAYVKNGSAYLVSGGALECASPKNYDVSKLVNYCNKDLTYQGKCDSDSIRIMDDSDFINIINYKYSDSKIFEIDGCLNNMSNKYCGYNNKLLDNGGYYWFNKEDNGNYYFWDADKRGISIMDSSYEIGIRPVIRLSSSVYVVSGSGTKNDPYVIAKESRSC